MNHTWHRNGAGYSDHTAGEALQNLIREERKERNGKMAKKRNCRRTVDESIIHEKAVKMRKMTDEQLVHYVEDRVEKARSEGIHQGRKKGSVLKVDVQSIVDEIGSVKGIGITKLKEIKVILEKQLEGIANG